MICAMASKGHARGLFILAHATMGGKGVNRMSENERGRAGRSRGGARTRRPGNQPDSHTEQPRQNSRARPQRSRGGGRQPSCLRVIPLGGVGEVGKNCTLLEYGENLILVDAGAAFPGEDEPGVDLLVPDVSYIRANAQRLR